MLAVPKAEKKPLAGEAAAGENVQPGKEPGKTFSPAWQPVVSGRFLRGVKGSAFGPTAPNP